MLLKNISMIFLVIIPLLFFQSGCSQKQSSNDEIEITNSSFDWIVGNWERTNDEVGKKTFENWGKKSITEFVGEGFTLAENDTIFKEQLRIIKIDNRWQLEVVGVNESPTIFEFTNYSENSFSCENKLNEFPKTINYSFDGNMLTARIADDKNEIIFSFVKIN